MKYYDKNGDIHDSIFKSFMINLSSRKKERKNVIEDIKVKQDLSPTPKDIKIDLENKKVCLVDELGNTIAESNIDPKLSETHFNIDIKSSDIALSTVNNIDKLLNSESLSKTIDKLQSNSFRHTMINGDESPSVLQSIDWKSLDANGIKDALIKVIKNALPAIGKIIVKIIKKRFIK